MSETPELSRPIALDKIGPAWQHLNFEAGPAERAALAKRFDLLDLAALKAELRLRRVRAGRYVELIGRIAAEVTQSCVVTLDPVPTRLEEEFRELYGPIGAAPPETEIEVLVDPESPEPVEGNEIDVGEAVAQNLALALDPYPRAPGVPPPAGEAEAEARPSPFAALAALKKPQ